MNTYNNLILVKDEDKTQDIVSCKYVNGKYEVVFNSSSKVFSYSYMSIRWIRNPQNIDTTSIKISYNGKILFDIKQILKFDEYYRVFFCNGKVSSYLIEDLVIEKNNLSDKSTSSNFEYFKCIADKVSIITDEGKKILLDQLEKINFIGSESALAYYLNHDKTLPKITLLRNVNFPLVCNELCHSSRSFDI